MRLRLLGLCAGVLLFGATEGRAYPVIGFDDINVGDRVLVTAVQGGYRVQELAGAPHDGDPLADFLTFCIEPNAPIGDGIVFVVTGFGYDITPSTAYIYDRFRNGGFPGGYPPLAPGAVPPSTNFDIPIGLQTGIWWTEGEPGGIDNAFAKCGQGIDSAGLTGCQQWVNLGKIRSLQLRFDNDPTFHNGRAQSLLVKLGDNPDDPCLTNPRLCGDIPVPEPGSMLLLGSGLMGLATMARRRLRK